MVPVCCVICPDHKYQQVYMLQVDQLLSIAARIIPHDHVEPIPLPVSEADDITLSILITTKVNLVNNPPASAPGNSGSAVRGRPPTIIDSGCNRSIFIDRDMFTDYRACRVPITTAGGVIMSDGVGTVGLLHNCLHVSSLPLNLVSYQQLHSLQMSVLFTGDSCRIYKNDPTSSTIGKLVYSTTQEDGLYPIHDLTWLGVASKPDTDHSS